MSERQTIHIQKAQDLSQVNGLISGILGQPCWNARLGYGDELKLDIGAQIADEFKGHGSWILGSRGTAWKLINYDGLLVTEDYSGRDYQLSDAIEEKIQIVVGTQVVKFDVLYSGLNLIVGLSNGCELSIMPTTKDDLWDLSYWELFMPNGFIEFGPHAKYSFYSKRS